MDRSQIGEPDPPLSLGKYLKDNLNRYKTFFEKSDLLSLKEVIHDLFNPVIQSIDTASENNRQLKDVNKLISSLHEQKI